MATLGAMIRQQRERAGLTQRALAAGARVPLSTVIKLEGDTVARPSWFTVAALARCMGLSLDTFAGAQPARDDERGGDRS